DTAKAALANDQAKQDAAIKSAQNNVNAAQAGLNTAQVSVQQAQAKAASTSQSGQQSANQAQGQVKTAQASLATTAAPPTQADIGKVKVGNPVSFTVSAFPGKTFAGQVLQIQPTGTTTSNVVNFAVTSSIKSVEGTALYPGMTAQVTVTTNERDDVDVVPNQ